jgi:hypothetical protein
MYNDFIGIGLNLFKALKLICELSDDLISKKLFEFYTNVCVSATTIAESFLQVYVESSVTKFMSTLKSVFLTSLNNIRYTTQSNVLISSLMTNYYVAVDSVDNRIVFSYQKYYGPSLCTCASLVTCADHVAIFNHGTYISDVQVPGIYIACYVL